MKKLFCNLCIGLLLLVPFGLIAEQKDQPGMFLQTDSPEPLSVTVKVFKEEVSAGGWSILNTTNMAGILSAKGYTLAPVLIFDVCSGKYSARILARDEFRFVTPLMPCRASIYQTSKGQVVIARLNARAVAPMLDPELADIMLKSSEELETIISKTISRLSR